jgi:predicted peptidase
MGFRTITVLAVVCGVLAGCATKGDSAKEAGSLNVPTGFINKTLVIDGRPERYVVYVPYDYTPDRVWPLILFLHGAGERGEDGLKQSAVGIGHAIRKNPERFPCIVVMPQCPEESYWKPREANVLHILNESMAEYRVDPDRVYLTGLSMGGFGTWYLGGARPDLFAAYMPICGGGRGRELKKLDPKNTAGDANPDGLAQRPIWAFHGDADGVVPPEASRFMVVAVKAAGGKVKYTEFPEVGHNSWDAAYGDPKAIRWLLKQRRE